MLETFDDLFFKIMKTGRFSSREKRNRVRILLLHNIVAPYRLPLFQKLSEKLDLHILFCKSQRKDRLWTDLLKNYSFKYEILYNITFPKGDFVINPSLLFKLLTNPYQVYIAGENFENILSILLVLLVAKLFRRSFILWSGVIKSSYIPPHSNSFLWGIRQILVKQYRRFLYRFANSFIAYGKMSKRYLMLNGVSEEKIHFGTQVININHVEETSSLNVYNELKDKKILLFLGYFKKRKGIEYLIKAYFTLNREDTILVLAGDGEEIENLRSMAKGRDDIIFPGYVEGEEKAFWYSIADIFILPTLHDPWGLVINEAMTYGLPIITTERAGCSIELIKGNGFILEAENTEELCSILNKMLDDDELREKMGKKSKEIIKHYNLNYAVNTFVNAIKFAIKHSLSSCSRQPQYFRGHTNQIILDSYWRTNSFSLRWMNEIGSPKLFAHAKSPH